MSEVESIKSNFFKKIFSPLPFWVYIAALISWPNAGLGNNGHCDAWYYWGMGHGSEIVRNTFSWNYYPASRAPLFVHGWLIPESIHPVIWSKLFMLGGMLWPMALMLLGISRKSWPIAINGYILANLVPLIFSQSGANYSGITFNLLSVLGIVILLKTNTIFSNIVIGLITGLIVFANIETLVLFPPLVLLYWSSLRERKLKNVSLSVLGLITSYFLLVILLILGHLGVKESFIFPKVQIETMLRILGDESFFGPLENPWFIATPLLAFHIVLILVLTNKKIKALEIFPKVLFKVVSIQLIVLILGQISGYSVTFQSGFDAIIGFWPLSIIYYYILLAFIKEKKNYLSLLSLNAFIYLGSTQIMAYLLRKTQPELELATFSAVIPVLGLLVIGFFLIRQKPSKSHRLLAVAFAIPMLATHTLDYSYAFYTQENRIFSYDNNWSGAEYKAASQAVSMFKGKLKESTAIGAIEDPTNSLQTSLLRASTRAFSSCGFAWSRFESLSELFDVNTESWPSQVILGSYRQISDGELRQAFKDIEIIERYEFQIQDQNVFWSVIKLRP
jgi:hypothetical protein